MTADDNQEDDTTTAPGPEVKVGDNVSDGNEPKDSQQTPQPQQSRLPPLVFTYNAVGQPASILLSKYSSGSWRLVSAACFTCCGTNLFFSPTGTFLPYRDTHCQETFVMQ